MDFSKLWKHHISEADESTIYDPVWINCFHILQHPKLLCSPHDAHYHILFKKGSWFTTRMLCTIDMDESSFLCWITNEMERGHWKGIVWRVFYKRLFIISVYSLSVSLPVKSCIQLLIYTGTQIGLDLMARPGLSCEATIF